LVKKKAKDTVVKEFKIKNTKYKIKYKKLKYNIYCLIIRLYLNMTTTQNTFIFREEEKVKINYNKPLSFQSIDWRGFDFKAPFDQDSPKGTYRKEFRVQLFGVTSKGRSVSVVIKGFKPFFFAEIPFDWNKTKIEQFIKSLNKQVPEYETKSLISYDVIKQKKFRGFTNNTYYPFIKFEFQSLSGFNKYKRALEGTIVVGGSKIQLPLYESNLEPIMRLMHITGVEPSGWIQISKYTMPEEPYSKCQIDIEAHFKYMSKIDKNDIAPLIIASFDIESDSSHGDFPQARKKYTKLATDIINHYQKTRNTIAKLQKSGENPTKLNHLVEFFGDKEKYFYELIKAGFLEETPLRDEEISFVYTKDGIKPRDVEIREILMDVIKICDRTSLSIRANRELKEGVQTILRRWVNKKDKFKKEDDNGPNEKDIYQLEDIIQQVSQEHKLDYNILYSKIFSKDVMITLLTNLFDQQFPPVNGDPVIQIATVVYKYGDPSVSYRHIVTLDTCSPIEDAEVVSCEDEADVLLEWAKFINKLDPDIMTGYNIFGFDYSFLYYRAKELGVIEEFSKISRLPNHEATLLEKNLSSAALGDNTMRFIDMTGRVQIDLLKVIQRDHNLGSYKLDSVAEHFISGKIGGMRKDDPYWIEIKNTIEIDKGNYIIIRQAKDGDKFNRGDKIQVLEKESIDGKDWIKLDIPFEEKVLGKKPMWGLGKDDVNYKDIFSLQKTGGPEGRRTIGVYCIQDCVLCIRLIRKLEIIANNIGMANVSIVPFSYIFLRGQGVKIFSLVSKECRDHNFLIPVLNKSKNDDLITDDKAAEIRKLLHALDDDDAEGKKPADDDDVGGNNFRHHHGDADYHLGERDNTGLEYAGMGDDDDGYEGAIVLPPRPGIYLEEPVSVLDYGSLYPSSMISENLSHDSIVLDPAFDNLPGITYGEVTYDVKKWIDPGKKSLGKHTVGQKTCRFAHFPDGPDGKPGKGIIPLILQKLLAARKFYKKKKDADPDPFKKTVWEGLQLAYKVTANSLYGQIGARTSPIYLKDVAASTTATGRGLLTFARDFVLANFEGAEIVYGDSVIGKTPLLLRNTKTNQIYIESIDNLTSNYSNLKRDNCNDFKESCELNDVETWTEKGWTKIQRVIRHKLAPEKKLFRITTHTGSVVVTDDHSLLNPNGEKVSPKDIKIGDPLLHSFPDLSNDLNNNIHELFNNTTVSLKQNGMLEAMKTYMLYKSMGYNVLIDTCSSNINSYCIMINNDEIIKDQNKIKKIEEWDRTGEDYVYDLTTDNHHFHAGVGNLIVHNTDSIFIKFKLFDDEGNKLTGVPALQKSIDTGLHAEHLIQRYLKPPHVLEYEKTFWPFILFTKKRYVGNLYETDVNEYAQKSMGIVLKRRDNAPIVKYVYGGVIDAILNKKSLELSISFLKQSLMDLINGKFDIQMLVISKTLRSTYKDPESIAHKVLADRMGERDPGNKPQSNDRIPYVYIKVKTNGPKEKVLQGDKIEHVNYVRDNNMKPDYVTYLENQIMKPVSQIYELVVHKLDGFNKNEDYFERLTERYYEKYQEKSDDFVHDKIQQKKQEEVEKLLFQDALRKAHNQKANLQEISSWLIIDENSKEPEKVHKKSPTAEKNYAVKKTKTVKPITDWFV
jgi:DNA polymerase elongation subunit (family B)